MKPYRSIVGLILVAIATLLVSCSSGPVAQAPTYSPEQISQIALYTSRIEASQMRLPELAGYIDQKDWTNVDNFIHGPLGELRTRMAQLANLLLPAEKAQAKALSDEVAKHLERLSAAAEAYNSAQAVSEYDNFVIDLTALLNLVPAAARPADLEASAAAPARGLTRRQEQAVPIETAEQEVTATSEQTLSAESAG